MKDIDAKESFLSVRNLGGRHIKHGAAIRDKKRSKEYNTWCNIKQRCYNKNSDIYKHYGGRGIAMCDAWLGSYPTFLTDMGLAPSPKHSIERIDNNGNYEPSNCKWATAKEQNSNRRKRMFVDKGGIKLRVKKDELIPLSDLANALGISPKSIISRYNAGWPLSVIIATKKLRNGNENNKPSGFGNSIEQDKNHSL